MQKRRLYWKFYILRRHKSENVVFIQCCFCHWINIHINWNIEKEKKKVRQREQNEQQELNGRPKEWKSYDKQVPNELSTIPLFTIIRREPYATAVPHFSTTHHSPSFKCNAKRNFIWILMKFIVPNHRECIVTLNELLFFMQFPCPEL